MAIPLAKLSGVARIPEPALYSAVHDPANSLITVTVTPAAGGVTTMKVRAMKSSGSERPVLFGRTSGSAICWPTEGSEPC